MIKKEDVKLHHLTISVSDLNKSQTFYEKLGFSYSRDFERKDYPAKFRDLIIKGFRLRLVEFQGKKQKIPKSFNNPIKNFKVIGPKHFALEVTMLKELKKRLDKDKFYFLDGKNSGNKATIQKGISGVDYIFTKDPDRNIVELVEERKDK